LLRALGSLDKEQMGEVEGAVRRWLGFASSEV
jgi:hypothetical protein